MNVVTLCKVALVLALLVAVVVLFVSLPRKRKELALALGAFALSLLMGEVFLRLFFPQISDHSRMFQPDPQLGWRFAASQRGRIVMPGGVDNEIATNALGFRDRERDLSKEGKKRILVLGDSFVSNISVKAEEVFTRVMETQLRGVEVWNFGVNGYGQVQESLLLQSSFDRVRPDLVVVMVYLRNDFLDNVDPTWVYARPVVSVEEPGERLVIHPASGAGEARPPAWKIYARSHLWTLIGKSLDKLLHGPPPSELAPELELCRKDSPARMDQMVAAMTGLLTQLQQFAAARGVPLVFVLAPSHVQVYDHLWRAAIGEDPQARFDRALPDQRLMTFAQQRGLKMLDLLPAFLRAREAAPALYNEQEQHWTREGNQLAARVLVEYLRANELAD